MRQLPARAVPYIRPQTFRARSQRERLRGRLNEDVLGCKEPENAIEKLWVGATTLRDYLNGQRPIDQRIRDTKARGRMQTTMREESLLDSLQPASIRRHPDILGAVALHP